jgi:hypothetical protein
VRHGEVLLKESLAMWMKSLRGRCHLDW